MRRVLAVATLLILAASCGVKEDASPLDVLPESAFVMCAIADPSAVVSTIDDYIEQGVPLAGPDLIAKQIFEGMNITSLDSLTAMTGMDVHGTVVFYASGINPQTIGGAIPAPDPETFWTRTTEWGADWTDVEAIDGVPVKTFTNGDMTVFVATYRGLALLAGSRSEISTMIDRVEGRVPAASVTVAPSTAWMKMDVSMVGPMASSQLNMYRSQILSGLETEMSGGPMDAMLSNMVVLYLDAIDLFLLETKDLEYSVTFGPETIDVHCLTTFVPGSSLAQLLQPVEAVDHLPLLPAGDVMAARVSMPPEATREAMAAVLTALGGEIDQEYIDFTAQLSANTAFAMYGDGFMHFTAAYDMPDGSDMEDVAGWISYSLDFSSRMMQGMPGLTFTAPRDTVIDGISYLTYGTSVDPAAMEQLEAGTAPVAASEVRPMEFTVWMTQCGDALVMEMSPEPDLIVGIAGGTFTGETQAADPYFSASGSDEEMVFGMDFPAYMAMIANMMGDEAGFDAEALSGSSAWMYYTVDLTDQGIVCRSTVDGSDLAEMIGMMAASAGAMAPAGTVQQ